MPDLASRRDSEPERSPTEIEEEEKWLERTFLKLVAEKAGKGEGQDAYKRRAVHRTSQQLLPL